jgi:hypothetical protein
MESHTLFDKLQCQFVDDLSKIIHGHLKSSGLNDDKVLALSEKILFDSAALLDGSQTVNVGGSEYLPKLSFENEETGKTECGSSFMHELAAGHYDDLASEKNEKDIGFNYKTGDVLVSFRTRGGVALRDSSKQLGVIEAMEKAISPVLNKYSLILEAMSVMPLSKIMLQDITCEKCGVFDPTDPHGSYRD